MLLPTFGSQTTPVSGPDLTADFDFSHPISYLIFAAILLRVTASGVNNR